jgi:hypothetical protein
MGALSLPGEDIAKSVVGLVKDGIDKIWPDPAEADAAKLGKLQALIGESVETLKARVSVIVAEASGTGLKANWRPITMLCFVGILMNNYVVFPYISLFGGHAVMIDVPENLWELIKLGMGGYVVGRSVEKVMPGVVDAVKAYKK